MILKPIQNEFYMVIFPTHANKYFILDGGPYILDGNWIYLCDWHPNFDPHSKKVEDVLVWISLKNLPWKYKN